jgi:uncharacterized membrane protein YgdD (TMEM256/DUF423 family)
MNKRIVIIASIFGMLAVILGAFGAHGLRDKVTAVELDTWRTAVDYQFYHTLALLFLSRYGKGSSRMVSVSFISFTIGIILFSGSLYILSTRTITGLNWPFLGPITPVGGTFMIIGWVGLLLATLRTSNARI